MEKDAGGNIGSPGGIRCEWTDIRCASLQHNFGQAGDALRDPRLRLN
jgi:hypothetical protein